jgi:hypothetical protein
LILAAKGAEHVRKYFPFQVWSVCPSGTIQSQNDWASSFYFRLQEALSECLESNIYLFADLVKTYLYSALQRFAALRRPAGAAPSG